MFFEVKEEYSGCRDPPEPPYQVTQGPHVNRIDNAEIWNMKYYKMPTSNRIRVDNTGMRCISFCNYSHIYAAVKTIDEI